MPQRDISPDDSTALPHSGPAALIVDDDPGSRFILSHHLIRTGKVESVYKLENGQKGIEYLKTLLQQSNGKAVFPELILLDINMPVADGWMFLNNFRQFPVSARKNTTVIMMSSMANPENKKKASEYEFVEHLLDKPLDKAKVEALVNTYL